MSEVTTVGDVRTQTPAPLLETAVASDGWQEVRRGGKLLFEWHPETRRVRIVRNGRVYVVELAVE